MAESKQSRKEDKPTIEKNGTEWVEILDPAEPVLDFEEKIPDVAHKYPFELDNFQKLAVMKLEEHGHVFVAAHTSAGKTAIAEYAIALSLKHCKRVIYTSPVKALSNQKYKEFSKAFGDVGLVTGDVRINSTARCLVMTTEILRSMVYNGSDVIEDLEYVIFDEVHYINDPTRGYVWEEVLILLPQHCGVVMLSATAPNTQEFADWFGRTKQRMIYVISTEKRPVPLCHYLYTGHSCGCLMVLDQDGNFIYDGWNMAKRWKMLERMNCGGRYSQCEENSMWNELVSHLKTNDKLPTIAFVLSRRRCDDIAENLKSQDLTTDEEKTRIHTFIQACLKKLSESDQKLPQVTMLQSLLACGICIHHSGILPIMKEVVEMLFQLGLVKILFATETFALGVNMPARTVVFDSIRKFDGRRWRTLFPSEYIQMAGRAGRRGLDDTGSVIILCKEFVPRDLPKMMLGEPSNLSSQFRMTYSTMLGLLRTPNVSIESLMKLSFHDNQSSLQRLEMQRINRWLSQTPKTPNFDYLKKEMEWKYDELEKQIPDESSLYPEYQKRMKFLKKMSYVDANDHVTTKGRVAFELGRNELLITEIIFRNILTDLNPAQAAALLSCLVVEAKIEPKTPKKLDEMLERKINEMQDIHDELWKLEREYEVGSDEPTAQSESVNLGLVDVVYEWTLGKPFCEIIQMTDVQEGIIVQSMQKLHEVLMNVRDVAKMIDDPILVSTMDKASRGMRRDIIFAGSLYTQKDMTLDI